MKSTTFKIANLKAFLEELSRPEPVPTSDADASDYAKYRGKCREMSEELCRQDPTLTLVRGHYHCPAWGEQPHWWCVRPDGTVVDPTARQFPSKGAGEYVPFDGIVSCAECGKEMKEEEADIDGNYAFCSYRCHGIFVGVL
jgi:hypothetical protein